jgi:4-hydroxyphenylpyruvate dioxygenase
LETGNKHFSTHVVFNGKVKIAFTTAYNNETEEQKDFFRFMQTHGDGVKDIFLNIDNVENAYNVATKRGAISNEKPSKIEDKDGKGYILRCSFEVQKDTNLIL